MRRLLYLTAILLVFVSCSKDKFSDEPQIKLIELDRYSGDNLEFGNVNPPHAVLELTDGNGDIGFRSGSDTSRIYIKNLLTGKEDSLFLPDLNTSATKNFKGELTVSLRSVVGGRDLPISARPYSDTLYFEFYVKDFAGNKSNVVTNDQAFIYYTLP